MNLNELSKLISDHISKEANLFFPDGIYGGSAYLIDEEGFFGPLQIHTYIVPARFTRSTKHVFMERVRGAGVSINESDFEKLIGLAKGLDLSYGDGWEIEPSEFVGMLLAGCDADTPYLMPPNYEYEDFEDFIEGALYAENKYTMWTEIEQDDVGNWIKMILNVHRQYDISQRQRSI